MSSLAQIWNAVVSVVARGKVTISQPGSQRTALQLTMLNNEVYDRVPLVLPYGMTALPTPGSDVIVLSVGGARDHKIALGADAAALRITDVAAGEFGFRDQNGQQVVFRSDRVEVTTPLKVVINAAAEIDITVGTSLVVNAASDIDLTSSTIINLTAPEVYADTPTFETSGNVVAGTGATGSFTTPTGQIVTVRDGIVVNIY